ncbi:MAG: DegT/DnrJ/EryC1/StrS family aminotransferase [Proteobacteria bacterium]|nr:DegT/DnrJ/EryC1/StrS family aminotransferase [Pseudomonadota bacterium]
MRDFIPVFEPVLGERERAYVADAVASGWVSSHGEYVERFEQEFARFCGCEYALTVSSGTAALHLTMLACRIGAGDEVIIPDFTFIATANAVAYTSGRPVFADIDPETLCMDPASVERLVTSRTKAIIPVHIYGHPANMPEIQRVADKYGLVVVEDAAEAHGAMVQTRRVGSFGDMAAFSFYGNKIITTGEGGMLTTNHRDYYERAKHLRDQAMSSEKRYWHDAIGYNYRMTNLQAALGLAQLERIDELIEGKRTVFTTYASKLKGRMPGLRLNRTAPWATNVFWAVCLEVDFFDEARQRALMAALREHGVDTRPYFYPASLMPMFRRDEPAAERPVTMSVYSKGIILPSSANLSQEEIEYICEQVLTALRRLPYDASVT